MAFGQLNKRCKDGSRRLYDDKIRSVEGKQIVTAVTGVEIAGEATATPCSG